MSFLNIPTQEGLFTTIKSGKSAAENRSRVDDEDNDEEDEDDETENVHLIPRCSPIPRRRGQSIFDETAEYMRIQAALPAGKRVLFADTTGGDLVDVKEFIAFNSDEDEEEEAIWEHEEAKYRHPKREPTYLIQPEFISPTGSALLQAVRNNKLEVEQISPVEGEPLAFTGVVRVLSISFQKAVYIRSTMDNWATYFDYPADYVQGSYDGDTDQFSFKLTFAPPYITHGSRIEFVIRYETDNGDFWANNSSMNYVITLLQSYDDDSAQTGIDLSQLKGIMRPPKDYSMEPECDSEEELQQISDEAVASNSEVVRPAPVCPVIVQPEIDIEIAVHPSRPPVPSNQELPSVDGALSAHTVSPGEQFPCMSSETTPQTNLSFVLSASESVQPNKSQPLPRLHCELDNQTSEQPIDSSPSALLSASTTPRQQESRPSPDSSQAEEEIHLQETNLWLTGEDRSTDSLASRPCLELPAESVSSPSVTLHFEQDVAVGLSELVAGLSEDSTEPAANHEGSTSALSYPLAESPASLGAEGEARLSPELTESISVSTGVTEVTQNVAHHSVSTWEETEDAHQISPDMLLENLPSPESGSQSEHGINRNLMPSIIFLSGVVSLSIVFQEPSALFIMGLLLVLNRL